MKIACISDLHIDLNKEYPVLELTAQRANELEADLLLIVADCSDPRHKSYLEVTEKILSELGAGGIPRIIVYNKADLCDPPEPWPREGAVTRGAGRDAGEGRSIYISARDEASVRMLTDLISEQLFGARSEEVLLIPYEKGGLVHELMEAAEILDTEYTAAGTRLRVRLNGEQRERFASFCEEQ